MKLKVVGFNGSSRKKGNTSCSLNTVFAELEKAGIETEMIHVGKEKMVVEDPETGEKVLPILAYNNFR